LQEKSSSFHLTLWNSRETVLKSEDSDLSCRRLTEAGRPWLILEYDDEIDEAIFI